MRLEKMAPRSMGDYLSENRKAICDRIHSGYKTYSMAAYIYEQNQHLHQAIDDLYNECIRDAALASTSAHLNNSGVHSNRFEHDETYQILSSGQKLFLSSIREEHRQFCERMLKNIRLRTVIYCLKSLPDSYQEILIEYYIDQKRCYELSTAGKGNSQSSKDRGKRAALKALCDKYNQYITNNENLPVMIHSMEDTIQDFRNYIDERFLF